LFFLVNFAKVKNFGKTHNQLVISSEPKLIVYFVLPSA